MNSSSTNSRDDGLGGTSLAEDLANSHRAGILMRRGYSNCVSHPPCIRFKESDRNLAQQIDPLIDSATSRFFFTSFHDNKTMISMTLKVSAVGFFGNP